MKTRLLERRLNLRSHARRKGGHFRKKNRPKMNLEEIVEEEFIRDLVKRKLSYQAIGERLQALYPGRFGAFSWRFLTVVYSGFD